MKKSMKNVALFVLAASLLGACGNSNNPSGNTPNSSSTPNSSNILDEEYAIVVRSVTGVTITADKQKAKAGETVTLTVHVLDGYTLNSITINDKTEATKVSDTEYTFVMPYQQAIIRARLAIEGDVIISGDLSIKLTADENGVYSAKNVKVENQANLAYFVKGNDDASSKLSVIQINNYKTNADVQLYNGTDSNISFTLAGNAYYDFYYDPSDATEPCYIQRVGLIHAPENISQFQSLLSGRIKSDPTTYPTGITSVSYTSTKSNDDYHWDLYQNASYATVKTLGTETEKAFDYRKLDGDLLTIVDTYVESTYDDSRADDNKKISAKYSVVDEYQDGYSSYQRLAKDAEYEANRYSHDVYSIDRNIHYGYRTGFDTEFNDTLKSFDRAYSYKTNDDGTYTVNIQSWKTTAPVTDSSSGSTYGKKEHLTYDIEITFNKAGNLLSGSYIEKTYDDKAYDFDKDAFLPNGELQFTLNEEMHFAYTYGEAKSGSPSFDTDPYFVKSIDSFSIEKTGLDKNKIALEDCVSEYVVASYSPATALDTWQYGIISSSNTAVIGPRSVNEPLLFVGKSAGTSTLTLGNYTTNNVTKTVDVTIEDDYRVMQWYMSPTDGDYDNILAARATILANTVREVYCYASKLTSIDVPFTPVSSNETYLRVSKNGQKLVLDATGAKDITEAVTVNVTIQSPKYEEGIKEEVFSITINPNNTKEEGIVGVWTGIDASNSNQTVTLTFNEDGTGSLVTTKKGSFTFNYTFDKNSGTIRFSKLSDYELNLLISYDGGKDEIKLCAYTHGWYDEYEQDVVGSYLTDADGYDTGTVYVTLTR